MRKLQHIAVHDGRLTVSRLVPREFAALAHVVYDYNIPSDLSGERLEEMAAACMTALDEAASGPGGAYDFDPGDSRDAQLIGVVLSIGNGTYAWEHLLSDPDLVEPFELAAAYALACLDSAMEQHAGGNYQEAASGFAIASAIAMSCCFEAGYSGSSSHASEVAATNARKKRIVEAKPVVLDFIGQRLREGDGKGQPWKSPRRCASIIASEVIALCATHGAKIKTVNPERTIYDWMIAAGMTKPDWR